jgi:hypothetical protein
VHVQQATQNEEAISKHLKQASLTMSALPSIKLRTPLPALAEERHFASLKMAIANRGSLPQSFSQELSPIHASLRIHANRDYFFELRFL